MVDECSERPRKYSIKEKAFESSPNCVKVSLFDIKLVFVVFRSRFQNKRSSFLGNGKTDKESEDDI